MPSMNRTQPGERVLPAAPVPDPLPQRRKLGERELGRRYRVEEWGSRDERRPA